jgi:hypothetical protein
MEQVSASSTILIDASPEAVLDAVLHAGSEILVSRLQNQCWKN